MNKLRGRRRTGDHPLLVTTLAAWLTAAVLGTWCSAESDAPLPGSVKVVWDLTKACREKTPTR